MGNALRFLTECCKPQPSSPPHGGAQPQYLGPHGVTTATVGVSAFAHDILNFDITSQVPDGLNRYVVSSKKAQANWYRKLSVAWKEAKPPPRTPEEASRLVILTLNRHQKADVEGLLAFYSLPYLDIIGEISSGLPSSLPEGVKFKLETLTVDARNVVDGDGIDVFVDTSNPRESSMVPIEVQEATVRRAEARAVKNYALADALHKNIVRAGYRVLNDLNNNGILARKYRIRLRGIDAPENSQPYGKEAREELTNLVQGKCLEVFFYDEDQYHRSVADVYCNGIFLQEVMLKRGLAWHYVTYDKRPEFAEWEKSARAARRGLWAQPNPEKPWDYRRDNMRDRHNGAR